MGIKNNHAWAMRVEKFEMASPKKPLLIFSVSTEEELFIWCHIIDTLKKQQVIQ
jgi:hypothetical protein